MSTAVAAATSEAPGRSDGGGCLRCPGCGYPLDPGRQTLTCRGCAQVWPVADGVPQFGGLDRRVHPLSRDQRQALQRTAARAGWDVALHDVLRQWDPVVYRQAVDEYQAQWRFVLPLTRGSRVLDLQCGWGAVAFSLAESVGRVVAADSCPALAGFVATRARQAGYTNLQVVQLGWDQPLPFARHSFDAVVLMDALCWAPARHTVDVTLGRIHTILRPGGSLLLAESSLPLLPGRRPGARLGSPRRAANYAQRLRAAGFQQLRFYAPLPSHRQPFFLVPLDSAPPLGYFVRAILAGQDFTAHIGPWARRTLYRLARSGLRHIPLRGLVGPARLLAPSVAVVART